MLLDHRVRRGGSHHQKIVVVRRQDPSEDRAFVGGIDLAHGRRDGPDRRGDPQRAELDASNYGPHPPWHDVHVEICGPAVDDIAYTFRERWDDLHHWTRGTRSGPSPVRLAPARGRGRSLAPDVTPPVCGDLAVQVLRTYPAPSASLPIARDGERSIARAYTKVFAHAQAFIYLEDQYLWSFDGRGHWPKPCDDRRSASRPGDTRHAVVPMAASPAQRAGTAVTRSSSS